MKEKKSKKIKKGTNAGIQVLLCILAGGYFLFFTSKIWMPNNETLIEPTPLYARQVMNRHEVYLSQWAYSVKDRAMEVIIEIEAKDLVSEGIEFEAVDRTAGKLPIQAVTEHTDYLVLRITNVPEKWKEISIRLWEKEEKNAKLLRLYTNIEKVDKVAKLPQKEEMDYDSYGRKKDDRKTDPDFKYYFRRKKGRSHQAGGAHECDPGYHPQRP